MSGSVVDSEGDEAIAYAQRAIVRRVRVDWPLLIMEVSLVDVFIVYFAGLLLAPNFPAGRLRRALELVYAPVIRLGLWHRWSMYAPEVPTATRLGLAGVVVGGEFIVVPIHGFDDDGGFGKARNLRFIAFQWALCAELTDYLKPALCARVLRLWREAGSVGHPDAVEIREYSYPSPPPGQREGHEPPQVRILWSQPIEDMP